MLIRTFTVNENSLPSNIGEGHLLEIFTVLDNTLPVNSRRSLGEGHLSGHLRYITTLFAEFTKDIKQR